MSRFDDKLECLGTCDMHPHVLLWSCIYQTAMLAASLFRIEHSV